MRDDDTRVATDEEHASFLPGLLLVEKFEVLTTLVDRGPGDEPNAQLGILVSLIGRLNKSETHGRYNVALNPQGMVELFDTVTRSYEHAAGRRRDSFGRPRS